MRILDEAGKELQDEDVDSSLGYLVPEEILKKHHDEVPEVEEKGHYYPETFYFTDGTRYSVQTEGENDPCVKPNDDGVSFTYVAPEGEEPREFKGCDVKYIIDVEHQEAKQAWDEMEEIQRYKLYTEEELKQRKDAQEKQEKQDAFLETGPDRLASTESDVNDITVAIADLIGV